MAGNLQLIKRRIKAAQNISQIARAMEMISASRIKKAKEFVVHHMPYSEKIKTIIGYVLMQLEDSEIKKINHPYLSGNNSNRKLLIAIGPERGLCGALFTNFLKKLYEYDQKNFYIITTGKKLEKIVNKLNFEFIASFPLGINFPKYSVIYPVLKIAVQYYTSGKVSEVLVLYNEFKTLFSQKVTVETVLPVQHEKIAKVEKKVSYVFEPDIYTVFSELIPYYVELSLYMAFVHSYTSEQAARMVAMQNAKENAISVSEFLTLSYNKLRQEKITNEIIDITNVQMV